ncbi:RHS repeat-associated core domain-containing protein [Kallotenue papyrolyticum]|uniref:RHS repeat-associated core domain-containing protein n=1 Tax=Kallotenue papyrolyticum TaxID=1325125 RepID=UPI0013770AAB|nr:RHS repeat-associated core domain-containing protein [Kallotenue papyrolyticum]
MSRQDFDPWGSLRSGGIPQTTLNYTGQRRDSTGLVYYHARYYDPVLGRFISADSVVPGAPDGSMDGVALKPLTVDFHEPGFVNRLREEYQFTLDHGFWFQLDDAQREEAKEPWGPQNPQALNRYAYVLNNPLRYTDPTGHVGITIDNYGFTLHLSHEDVQHVFDIMTHWGVGFTGAVATISAWLLEAISASAAAIIGFGAVATAATALALSAPIMLGIEWNYGSRGLDFRFGREVTDAQLRGGPIHGLYEMIQRPTVSHQHGRYCESSLCKSIQPIPNKQQATPPQLPVRSGNNYVV